MRAAACGDNTVKIEGDNSRKFHFFCGCISLYFKYVCLYLFLGDASGKNIIRATTDSPLSPPHSMDTNILGKIATGKRGLSTNGQRSLLDIILSADRTQSTKRLDFSGRLCTPQGQVAKLYPDFGTKEKEVTATVGATAVKEEGLGIKL